MKTLLSFLTAALLAAAAVIPAPARADVDIDFFYDSLAPYGSWMEVGDYGYVWHPQVDEDWDPYTEGRWVYTDAGWTWDSNEPYAWAVYHYGRWAQLEGLGWVWVPDNEWGPAWVSWRRSPDYVGWAPLPPEARFIVSIGFSNWVDSYYDIGPGRYRFVALNNFGARNLRTVFIDRSRNYTIINRTTNITNITYVNNNIVNRGPDFEFMARHVERPIPRFRLDRRQDFNGDPRSMRPDDFRTRHDDDTFHVFAPRVGNRAIAAPRQVVAAPVREVTVNRGWRGTGIPKEESDRLREKYRTEAKAPETLPERPRFERPTAGPRSPDGTPGRGRDGRPDDGPGGRPAIPTDGKTPGADKGPGRPGMNPGAPKTTDDTPDRPGKGGDRPGRPGMTPGVPKTTDDTPDRTGKGGDRPGRPGMTPGVPKTTDDTPDRPGRGDRPGAPTGDTPARPKMPGVDSRPTPPTVDRPGVPDRPSIPKVDRPTMPDRPGAPTRPAPTVDRPAAPTRPAPTVDRPAAPTRPAPTVDRPAPPARPAPAATPAPRPYSNGRAQQTGGAPPAARPKAPTPAAAPAPAAPTTDPRKKKKGE